MGQPIINAEACAALRAKDAIFSQIESRYGLPPNWQRPPGFETLARLILEQQVRLESAYTTYRLLVERLGAIVIGAACLHIDPRVYNELEPRGYRLQSIIYY